MKNKKILWLIILLGIAALVILYFIFRGVTPEQLSAYKGTIPLPLFTVIIAFADSFNPCNFFAFILLLTILVHTAKERYKVFLIGGIFISVVYVFYYLVMAAWLNIFNYLGFVTPLRISVAILAITVGMINCKELFFFGKGPSLVIPHKQKEKLYAKMRGLREVLANGSILLLIVTTITLAVFTSFIELLCTSGFPIIYTSVLATKHATNSLFHYYYLALYVLIYVAPLFVIISIIGSSSGAAQISQTQARIVKFVSGMMAITMGVILLVRPGILI